MTLRHRQLFVLVLWLGIGTFPRAAENEQKRDSTQTPGQPRLVTKVFAIADLLIPQDDTKDLSAPAITESVLRKKNGSTPGKQHQLAADQLIRVIKNTFAPQSWSTNGGSGTIEYVPLTVSLVVHQTPDVVEQIGEFLASQRQLVSRQITIEVKCFEAIAYLFEKADSDLAKAIGTDGLGSRPRSLDAQQVFRLLETLQGDQRSQRVFSSQLTVGNGRSGSLTNRDRTFPNENVTPMISLEFASKETDPKYEAASSSSHKTILFPLAKIFSNQDEQLPDIAPPLVTTTPSDENEQRPGVVVPPADPTQRQFTIGLRPAMTPDERAIWLDYDLMHSLLYHRKELTGYAEGHSVPLTYYESLTGRCKVLNNRTHVMVIGITSRETFYEGTLSSSLSKIPIVGFLFRGPVYRDAEPRILLVMLTPRISTGER